MVSAGLEELAEVVGRFEVPAHGDAIVEARRLLDVVTAKVAAAEADYDRTGGPEADGFGSLAAFERHRCRLAHHDATKVARRATRTAAWPELGAAWQTGVLGTGQVDVVVALVPDRHIDRFAAVAGETAEILAPLSVHDTRIAVRDWVRRADAAAERDAAEHGIETPAPEPDREVFLSRSLDDVGYLNGHLDPDSTAYVEQALAAATRDDTDDEHRTPPQRRADALVAIARFYLDHAGCPGGAGSAERLTVLCDITTLFAATLRGAGVRTRRDLHTFLASLPELGPLERGLFLDAHDGTDTTARTLDGNPISAELVAAIASSATLERLLTTNGRILDLGRSVRTFTPAQRRAILARDGACRAPGCTNGPNHCDIHHVWTWETGGPTDLTNGITLCRHCHHTHHRRGTRDHLHPNGTYTTTATNGTTHTTHPPGWNPTPRLPLQPDTDRAAPDPPSAKAARRSRSRRAAGPPPRRATARVAGRHVIEPFAPWATGPTRLRPSRLDLVGDEHGIEVGSHPPRRPRSGRAELARYARSRRHDRDVLLRVLADR